MIVKDEEHFVVIDSLNGLMIDAYSDTIDISFLATVGQYIGDNSVRYVQKCVKNRENFYEFFMKIEEAEELLAFLTNAYISIYHKVKHNNREEIERKHFSEISFYESYDLIWCELLTTKDVKPYDVPYLIEDFYYFEYGTKETAELIRKLERIIELAKKKKEENTND